MTSAMLRNVRFNSTESMKISHEQEQELLVNQRKNRPVSPHLQIYQPQLTWYLSGLHRVTGVAMSGAFYALTVTYAASALLGFPFEASTLVSAFAGLPFAVKLGAKAAMAFPFTFHSFNGLRHLVWDFGKELTLKGVYRTGYIVLALTGVFGTYLTFF
ncbi:succinate dehydrogenase, cytochrome b556 subunit [Candidozyma pseudohaemuli]|uniref:Succinate dehydrogenase, cytochrome b556 subunit n=1 Tax=Candidozyma pseudohaemuli TaxID=418784 RepID=A0A2P7YV43_9ASCO|nr:succinate dehydrogenase, cytochrome b556 subunit [[Candida] pseudohaemulonii]PSK39836.1 succinate dehydrogenase, cytochrome b556 subunit [[Candida] pseudohaemulonii]